MSALAFGCVNVTNGNETPTPEDSTSDNLQVANFKVRCWYAPEGDYWRFDAEIDDEDGPQDIASSSMEVLDVNSAVLTEFGVDPVVNNSACVYNAFTGVGESFDCVDCGNYGYRIHAEDELGHKTQKTYPGSSCEATAISGEPPEGWDAATPSPFCP